MWARPKPYLSPTRHITKHYIHDYCGYLYQGDGHGHGAPVASGYGHDRPVVKRNTVTLKNGNKFPKKYLAVACLGDGHGHDDPGRVAPVQWPMSQRVGCRLGGTGRVATPLAQHLREDNFPVLLANRSGKFPASFKGVRTAAIETVYLTPPPVLEMFPPMKVFIDFAVEQGMKRFVLMSAAALEAGGPIMGKVHEYLGSLNVEYCALRLTWFFDHIREHDKIVNAAGAGLIGWISTEDIADVAFKGLTDRVIEHSNPVMVGSEMLLHNSSLSSSKFIKIMKDPSKGVDSIFLRDFWIAKIMTEVLGREIKYRNVSEEEYTKVMLARGMPADYAVFMSAADVGISQGGHERLYEKADSIDKRRLREFMEGHRDAEE
ncbi:hypothetical protein B0H17DRAFT_1143719 [Mycena rosella]|uniref:NmrA-like domain-containing protein n=1 Tax=Mycena rosella TaxID=1033263 RepID=A0AAD7CUK2_MYCRO|nr:hypothetical protein B0H17DRAFT_1143719 [Mycena rosella]